MLHLLYLLKRWSHNYSLFHRSFHVFAQIPWQSSRSKSKLNSRKEKPYTFLLACMHVSKSAFFQIRIYSLSQLLLLGIRFLDIIYPLLDTSDRSKASPLSKREHRAYRVSKNITSLPTIPLLSTPDSICRHESPTKRRSLTLSLTV